MNTKLEMEKKYYFDDIDKIIKILNKNKYEFKNEIQEVDEYFTDILGTFIADRTCLRIRKTNNQEMEVTFKGKSEELCNLYAKNESNMTLPISKYNEMVELFLSLGYHSYSIVNKKRKTYTKKLNNIEFNVLIDFVEDVGNFVELELLTNSVEDIEIIKNLYNDFISDFKELELCEAILPYRDFVAGKIKDKILSNNSVNTLLFDLDGTLINSEKIFYDCFKTILKDKYSISISEIDYHNHELNENNTLISKLISDNKIKVVDEKVVMDSIYKLYNKKIDVIFKDYYTITIFNLLKELKLNNYTLGLVTSSKKLFVDKILTKLNCNNLFDTIICRDDIENNKPSPEGYNLALNKLSVDAKKCVAFEDSKRGIDSAKTAGLDVIEINEHKLINNKNTNNTDSIKRILLILLYHKEIKATAKKI